MMAPPPRVIAAACTLLLVFACTIAVSGCQSSGRPNEESSLSSAQVLENPIGQDSANSDEAFLLDAIPPYSGAPSTEVHDNEPFFDTADLNLIPREAYSGLDELGRCGVAVALLGPETIPTASRDSIGMIKPSGWQIAEYDWVDGKYLFNRCHLIAYALAGENDNPLNLITGTRSMNVKGMLPYEERIASYINNTGNHVLYRVTPVFEGSNLVASGALLEAQSIEDAGQGLCFCAWCYNVEPGVVIDYATGASRVGNPETETYSTLQNESASATDFNKSFSAHTGAEAQAPPTDDTAQSPKGEEPSSQSDAVQTYVLNTNTRRFHHPDCSSVLEMKEKNKQIVEATRSELIDEGYRPCGKCNP